MARKLSRDGCTIYTRSTFYRKNFQVFVEFTDHNGNTEIITSFEVQNPKKHRSMIERELLNEWYRKWCVYIEY
jgi:hypothetical protein